MPGAAGESRSDRRTRSGLAAGAARRQSASSPVQALAASAAYPAFRDRVRPGRPDRRLDDPYAGRGEHGTGRCGDLVPRPLIRNFRRSALSPKFISLLRACWVTHSPDGCGVIPAKCTRRVPCSMKNSTYRRFRNTVSTWKKSTARIVLALMFRNSRQVCPDCPAGRASRRPGTPPDMRIVAIQVLKVPD
jgi:hypothetical protein